MAYGAYQSWRQGKSEQKAYDKNNYSAGDYSLGGSVRKSLETQKEMKDQGQQSYDAFSQYKGQASGAADSAAAGIAENAKQQNTYGLAQAGNAGQLAGTARDAYGAAPGTYGDAGTDNSWRGANESLSRFNAGANGGRMANTYSALTNYAQQGPGPSAAEAQMASGNNANVAAQIALARSGRGAGANAAAGRNAAFAAADLGQRNAADTSALRAQEAATWRNQQLQAYGQAGSLASDMSSQNLTAQQAAASQYGSQYQAQAGAMGAAQTNRLGYLDRAMAGQQQQYDQGMGAYAAQQGALESAYGVQNSGIGQSMQAESAGQAAQAGYLGQYYGMLENEASRKQSLQATKMGGNVTISTNAMNAAASRDNAMVGAAGGLAGAYSSGGK